jgi:midasin (ATPase involved in ribosome maturation)
MTTATIKRARCPVCKEVFDSADITRAHIKEQHQVRIGTNDTVKNTASSTNKQRFHFNAYGQSILDDAKKVYPRPLLFTGLTGAGKSSVCRAMAGDMDLSYSVLNGHPDMDVSQLIGQWIPDNTDGITINWEHGALTKSVISGGIFLFEEINRAPPESHSRLFGLADDGFRLTMP